MPKTKLASDQTLMFWCPGCNEHHGIPVDGSRGWTWNGDLEKPTVSPSILVRQTLYGPDRLLNHKYDGPLPCETANGICHSFITEGNIQFLGDCTHSMAGQTVSLPDIEER